MARFRVGLKGKTERPISVYLDTQNALGVWMDERGNPEPYWELYPDVDDENSRFALDDVEGLTAAIDAAVRKWN